MKLSQFEDLLKANPGKPFHLILPGQKSVPISFHITEVAHVTKKFIDCGGRMHIQQTCQLQAWVWTDTDHRLLSGKMAGVLELAKTRGVLPAGEDLDIEIEYEDAAISQYTLASSAVTADAVVLTLESKHTDCLAREICLPTPLTMASSETQRCGCAPGCC